MSTVPTLQIHVNATDNGLNELRLKVQGLRSEVEKLDLDSPLAKLRGQMAKDITEIKNQLLKTLPAATAGGAEAFAVATKQATASMVAMMESQTKDLVTKVEQNGKRVLSAKQKQDKEIAEANQDAIKSGAFIKSTPTSQSGMVNKALGALSEGADAESVLKRYNSRVMEAVYNLPAFTAAQEQAKRLKALDDDRLRDLQRAGRERLDYENWWQKQAQNLEVESVKKSQKRIKSLEEDRLRDLQRAGKERLAQGVKDAADAKALEAQQQAMRVRDAKFSDMSARQQLQQVRGVAAQIRKGVSEENIAKAFAPSAIAGVLDLAGFVQRAEDFRNANKKIKDTSVSDAKKADDLLQAQRDKNRAFEKLDAEQRLALAEKVAASRKALNSEAFIAKKYAPLAVEAANDLPATRFKAEEFRAAQEQVKRLKALDDDRLRDLQRAGSERLAQEIKDAADVKALRKSQEREYDADARKNSSFRNATPAAQIKTLTRARGELELGASEASVLKNYGSQVLENTKNIHAFEAATLKGSSALKGMTLDMNDAHAAARGLAGGFGQLWLTYGNLIPLVSGAAVAYSFKTSVQAGAEFVESLYVIGELAGNTTAEVSELSSAALELGRTTQYGPLEAAKGMEILALAGLKASEVLNAIKPTLDFASAGGVNADKAAETLVAVSTAYGYTANQFSIVADIIAKSAAESMASVTNMSEAFKSSSVVAQQYGVTLEDMSKNLMFLAQIGITGSAAGTSVRNMYSELAKGSGKVADALAKVGVDAQNADGKMKPIVETMQQLVLATAQMDGKSANSFFQTISNERGGKDLAANVAGVYKIINDNQARLVSLGGEGTKTVYDTVEALRAQGKQAEANALVTKTINDAFTEMKAKQDEMSANTAGFSYFAALEKQLTPLSQFKTILATLQTDFVEAFTGAEAAADGSSRAINGAQDGLFLLGARLREIANSDGFRQFIADMVGGLTSFMSAVVSAGQWISEHGQAVKTLALFYGTYVVASAAAGLAASALTLTVAAFTPAATAAAGGVGLLTAAKAALATVTSGVLASSLAGSVVSYYAVASAAAAAQGATLAFNLAVVTLGISAVVAAGYATYLGLQYLFAAESAEKAAEREKASELDKLKTASEANKARIEQTLEQVRADNQKHERLEELRAAGMVGQAAEAKVAGEAAVARIQAEIAVSEQIARTTRDSADAMIKKRRAVLEFMSFLEPFLPGFDKERANLDAQSAKVQAEYESAIAKSREQGGASILATWSEFERKMEIERAKVEQAKKDSELANKRLTGTGTFTPSKDEAAGGERSVKAGYGRMLSAANDFYTNRKKTLDDAFSQELTDIKAQVRAREITEGAGYARSLVASAEYESAQRALIKTTYEQRVSGLVKLYAELPSKGKEREGALEVWVQELKKAETQFEETSKQLDQLSESRQKTAGYELTNKISDENKALDDLSESLAVYLEQLKLKSVADTAAAGATASQRAAMEASAGVNAKFTDDLAKHEKAAQKAAESVLDLQIQMALLAVESDLAGKALPEVYSELQGKLDKTLQGLSEAREKLKGFKGALASGAEASGQEASAKVLVAEYDKANTEIKDKLSSAIFDAATSGGKGLKDQLKKAVLDFSRDKFKLVMDVILNPVSKALAGFLSPAAAQAAGMANAATGGSGILGTLSNLSGISTLTSAISTGVAGAVGSTVSSIFGTVAGNTALGTTLGLGTGSSLAAASAASVAGGGAAAGAGLTSITSALGAIGPAGWAAIAAIAAVSLLGGRGETRSGASYETDASGRAFVQQGPSGGEIAGEAARAAFDFTTQTIRDTLKAVGSKAVLTGFTAGLESSKNGKGFEFAGGKIDGVGFGEFDGRAGGQFAFKSQSSEAAFANYILQLKQSTIEALQAATDVPKAIQNKLAGVDAAALDTKAIDTLLTEINGFIASIASFQTSTLAFPFENLKNLSFAAAAELADVSGGLENLKSNLGVYFDNFYSEEEKRTQKIKEINAITAGSGLDAATATRESFKALVNAQDLTTESGRKTYASLLAVSSSFASIKVELETLEQALLKLTNPIRTVEEIAQSLFSLGQASANLQADLKEAQGDKAGARRTRSNLETANFTDAEVTLYRYNESLKDQITVAAEATSLQERLRAATDSAAKAAERAKDAISYENKGLYDKVLMVEQARPLQERLTAATDSTAQAAKRAREAIDPMNLALYDQTLAAEQARPLQERLTAATDTTAQAAERARNAIDPMNLALYDTVLAVEANKAAMESFNSSVAGTIAKFNTPEQNKKNEYASIADGLRKAGFSDKNYSSLASDLEGANRDQIKSVVQKIFDGLGDGSGVEKENLRVLVDRLGDLKVAEAEESLKAAKESLEKKEKAQSDALSMLEKSIEREKKLIQVRLDLAEKNVTTIKSIFDLLKSNVTELYNLVDSTRIQAGVLSTTFIDDALRSAQTTGYLPEKEALEDAIAASRKNIDSTVYTSQNAQDIARLELAGKLSQLKDISGRQLTEAERQVASAKAQLEYYENLLITERAQVDALLGLNTSILSIPDALANLLRANNALAAANAVSATTAPAPAATTASRVSDYSIEAMIYGTRGKGNGEAGNKELYDWAYKWKDSGVTLARLNEIANVPAGTAESWAKANGLPAFANGGDHAGGWAMVGERGPELAYMPTARIYNAPDTSRLLSNRNSDPAVAALAAEMARVVARLDKLVKSSSDIADTLDEVTENGNAMRIVTL